MKIFMLVVLLSGIESFLQASAYNAEKIVELLALNTELSNEAILERMERCNHDSLRPSLITKGKDRIVRVQHVIASLADIATQEQLSPLHEIIEIETEHNQLLIQFYELYRNECVLYTPCMEGKRQEENMRRRLTELQNQITPFAITHTLSAQIRDLSQKNGNLDAAYQVVMSEKQAFKNRYGVIKERKEAFENGHEPLYAKLFNSQG